MSIRKILLAGLACAVLSTSAAAFQVQNGPAGGASAPSPAPTTPAPNAGLSESGAAVGGATGTEIRIPGLGRLGVIPKMDFGLELLYGANGKDRPVEPDRSGRTDPEELTIRGSIKHRF